MGYDEIVNISHTHKNPAIRDWVAMRLVDETHPRLGNKYRIYPMMNFSVAVDDHLMGLTHVLRGKDHLANTEKQKYLYDHMGWVRFKFRRMAGSGIT